MEIIFTKIAQPRWVLKTSALMILMIIIHAKFVSPFLGTKGIYR